MKKTLFIILFLYSIGTLANEQFFTAANASYAKEQYQEAILLYDSLLKTEYTSSELHYNLGNCYYKTKNWPAAIWHYESSLKIKHTTKASENLALAKLKIIDKIEEIPQLFYKNWWQETLQLLSTKNWQYLTLFCIWLVLALWIIEKLLHFKTSNYIKPLIISSFLLLTLTLSAYKNHNTRRAIIFDDVSITFSAPSNNSTELFSLHAGTKVTITDQIGSWINIKLSNGNTAWIIESSCKEF